MSDEYVTVRNGPDANGRRCRNFKGRVIRYHGSLGEELMLRFVIDEKFGGGSWTPLSCIIPFGRQKEAVPQEKE